MLRKDLEKRKSNLERHLRRCNSFLANAPKGKILVSTSRGLKTYYFRKDEGKKRFLLSREKDRNLIRALIQKDYCRKAKARIERELKTLKGEHVRSASEKTIANALYKADIPYKYEYPFRTIDGRILYPDFTIFKPGTGEIVLWEHLGMMERPKYVRDQMDKLDSYYNSGLFPGKGLILTFGDSYQGIKPDLVHSMIENLLK